MRPEIRLRTCINSAIIGAWLVIFIIQICCIRLLYNQIVLEARENVTKNMISAHNFIETKIDSAKIIQEAILNSSNVLKNLQIKTPDRQENLTKSISELIQVNHNIIYEHFRIIFVDENNTANCLSGKIPDEVVQKSINFSKKNNGEQVGFFTTTTPLFNTLYFCTSEQVTTPSTHKVDTEYLGTFIVVGQINTTELIRQSSIDESALLYLSHSSDKEDDIIISPKKNTSEKGISLLSQQISVTGWQLGINVPLNLPISSLFIMFILEIILLPLIFVFIQRFITYNLYNPIRKIYDFLNEHSKQRNHSRLNLKNQTELGIISKKINEMLDNTEKLYRRIVTTQQTLYENELVQKNTALHALQAQLAPHFIYNVLDCICGIANSSNVPQIADIVVSLAKLLRYTVTEEKSVLFINELEFLEYYLTIQNTMQPDKFNVKFDVDDETHSIHCLKMIIQPIVENSFKHAFKEFDKKYMLNIQAYLEDNFLIVKIHDNGCGITAENLKRIKEELSTIDKTFFIENNKTHIGISNIQYRIFLNYGKDYGIDIDSKENEYTEVTLRLPNKESL